jgi:hypothetical protein
MCRIIIIIIIIINSQKLVPPTHEAGHFCLLWLNAYLHIYMFTARCIRFTHRSQLSLF